MKYIFYIVIIIFLPIHAFGVSKFGPWNADVTSGDSVYRHTKIGHKQIIEKIKKQSKNNSAYNAAQGGSYLLVRFFQIVISPQDGPNCRFYPTCSHYSRQAIERFGAFLGAILTGDRLIRCNPYSKPGFDPVPKSVFSD